LAIGSALLVFFLKGELYAKMDFGLLRCFYGFACGIAAFKLYQFLEKRIKTINSSLFTALEAITFVLIITYIGLWSFGIGSMVAPLLFMGLVVLFAIEGGKISTFLKSKIFLLLGTLSYSIYMTHIFIAGKFFELPLRLLENKLHYHLSTQIDGSRYFGTNVYYGTAIELFYLMIVILGSYLSYRIIECPFRNWSKKALISFEANKKPWRLCNVRVVSIFLAEKN
jgi:peptidoglycan/LPS O-acetylase OafA/YrhL